MSKKGFYSIILLAALLTSCGGKGNTSASEDKSEDTSSSISDAKTMEGTGTEEDPYTIGNIDQLEDFAATYAEHQGSYYKLTADINYNNTWSPIGTGTEEDDGEFFGYFDGNGHSITNLKFTATNEEGLVGFFGVAASSYIHDLSVSVTIDLTISKLCEEAYIGSIVAFGDNTIVDNCSVNILKGKIASNQPASDANIYAGGLMAYAQYYDPTGDAIMTSYNSNNSVKGNIRLSADKAPTAAVGGVIGYINTGYFYGQSSIVNNKFEGIIEGGTYVGGIIGTNTAYVGLANNVVKSESITTYGNSYSYAGGIIGQAVSNTSVTGNIAEVTTIKANKSNNTYKSYVGDIVGYAAKDEYDELYDEAGALVFNNYATGATLSADNTVPEANKITALNADALTAANFNNEAWDFENVLPKSVTNLTCNITVNSNGGDAEDVVLQVRMKGDIAKTYSLVDRYTNHKAGYSMYGISGKPEGQDMWRWYTPVTNDVTLYAAYADVTPLIGTYNVTSIFYSTSASAGKWSFDETHFYWNYKDGGSSAYNYVFDGKHIFIKNYLGEWESSFGGYAYEIFALQADGSIKGLDVNDDSCEYKAVKTSNTTTFVDLGEDSKITGVWYNETNYVEITRNGLVKSRYVDPKASQVHYFGGVLVNGDGTYTMAAYGRLPATTFVYEPTKDLLIGETTVFAREEGIVTYSTEDGSTKVTIYNGETLVIINNELTTKTVTGDVTKDATITIDGTEYKVDGKKLTKEGGEEQGGTNTGTTTPTDDSFVGTYNLVYAGSTTVLVINADGTGTFAGSPITYTVNGNKLSFEYNYEEYTITKNGSSYSGTFTYDYEDYSYASVTKVA